MLKIKAYVFPWFSFPITDISDFKMYFKHFIIETPIFLLPTGTTVGQQRIENRSPSCLSKWKERKEKGKI